MDANKLTWHDCVKEKNEVFSKQCHFGIVVEASGIRPSVSAFDASFLRLVFKRGGYG